MKGSSHMDETKSTRSAPPTPARGRAQRFVVGVGLVTLLASVPLVVGALPPRTFNTGDPLLAADIQMMWDAIRDLETADAVHETAVVWFQTADGINGGDFNAGAWVTRPLNSESDPGNIVSLSANQFTLGPGTYSIDADATVFLVNYHQTRLRNITAGSTVAVGTRGYAGAATMSDTSHLSAVFTITSTTTFELQHRCSTTRTADGLGRADAVSFGEPSIHATLRITRH